MSSTTYNLFRKIFLAIHFLSTSFFCIYTAYFENNAPLYYLGGICGVIGIFFLVLILVYVIRKQPFPINYKKDKSDFVGGVIMSLTIIVMLFILEIIFDFTSISSRFTIFLMIIIFINLIDIICNYLFAEIRQNQD